MSRMFALAASLLDNLTVESSSGGIFELFVVFHLQDFGIATFQVGCVRLDRSFKVKPN